MGVSWGEPKTEIHICPRCLRAFGTSWGLRRHMKKDHKK